MFKLFILGTSDIIELTISLFGILLFGLGLIAVLHSHSFVIRLLNDRIEMIGFRIRTITYTKISKLEYGTTHAFFGPQIIIRSKTGEKPIVIYRKYFSDFDNLLKELEQKTGKKITGYESKSP